MTTKLEELQGRVVALKDTLRGNQQRRAFIQRDLNKTEDSIVSVKEELRQAEEDLYNYERTYVLTNVDEDLRAKDIEAFRKRIPAAMKKIEEQDKKKADREAQVELNDFKQKIQDSVLTRKVKDNGDE